jgi:hypothetical protein
LGTSGFPCEVGGSNLAVGMSGVVCVGNSASQTKRGSICVRR